MCDRTKVEVLARELAIQRWNGMLAEQNGDRLNLHSTKHTNIRDYCEENYVSLLSVAEEVIEILEKHK